MHIHKRARRFLRDYIFLYMNTYEIILLCIAKCLDAQKNTCPTSVLFKEDEKRLAFLKKDYERRLVLSKK
jgi:hypothetical protein